MKFKEKLKNMKKNAKEEEIVIMMMIIEIN